MQRWQLHCAQLLMLLSKAESARNVHSKWLQAKSPHSTSKACSQPPGQEGARYSYTT